MKNLFLFILLVSTLLLAYSCKKDEKQIIPLNGEYLPIQLENYWEIKDAAKITITGTKVLDNKLYYVFSNGTYDKLYRNENNKIYTISAFGNEYLIYDLTASVNEIWQYQIEGITWNAQLQSKTDTITINNTKIPNCYRFYFDNLQMADEENSVWLAPGIGFIKIQCMYCISNDQTLIKANIDNQIIRFP